MSRIRRRNYPKTIDEAVERLKWILFTEELEKLRRMKESDLHRCHFGLGLYIRNAFGLWRRNDDIMESCNLRHPDDVSTAIVHELWKRLQQPKGKPKSRIRVIKRKR